MENICIDNIWKRGFEDPDMIKVEEETRIETSTNTEKCIRKYKELEQSRDGNYISSDLMKLVFEKYANDIEYRRKYNLAVSNSAACLANKAFRIAISNPNVKHCIFVAGAYGSGKSFLIQSLYEKNKDVLEESVVYEGSITSKAIDEKIDTAIENGVIPSIIVLNPTLELSMKNIKERAKRIGRDVTKKDCVFVYANIYDALKRLKEKYKDISFVIYNKQTNIPTDLEVSTNVEDLNHGSFDEISKEYDEIIKRI